MRRSRRLAGLNTDEVPIATNLTDRRGYATTIGQRQLRSRVVSIERPDVSISTSKCDKRKRTNPDQGHQLPVTGEKDSPTHTRSSSRKKSKTEKQISHVFQSVAGSSKKTHSKAAISSSVCRRKVGTNESHAVTPSPSPRKLNSTTSSPGSDSPSTSSQVTLNGNKANDVPPNVFDLDTATRNGSVDQSLVGRTFQFRPSTNLLLNANVTDQSQYSSNVGYWYSYAKDYYQYLFDAEKEQQYLLQCGVARVKKPANGTQCSKHGGRRITRSQTKRMEKKRQDNIMESYEGSVLDVSNPTTVLSEYIPYCWHREIYSFDRTRLISNLYSVAEEFGIRSQTFHSAIQLLDIVLSLDPFKVKNRGELCGEGIPIYIYPSEHNALGM